ncbi:MAG: hypothetical protein GX660_24825, partial [Clostridiaceae bacterium]|nr:hypothetical protein [Clostridiaceae bacterium]
ETFLILKLGFKLFNLEIDTDQALLLSSTTAFLSIFIRKLPLIFGYHSLIMMLTLALLTKAILRIRLWHSIVSVLVGVLILGVLESSLLTFLQSFTSTDAESLIINPWLNVVYALPLLLVMYTLYWLVKRYNLVIFDLTLNED